MYIHYAAHFPTWIYKKEEQPLSINNSAAKANMLAKITKLFYYN